MVRSARAGENGPRRKGGRHPATPGAKASVERAGRGLGVQTVYSALKRDIVELTLPPGHPLDEMRLSERFAMSRTPIREALVRLAAEGLVTTLPNRNTIVAPIDFTALPMFFDALTLMYRVTTRNAALWRTSADLEVMRACQRRFAKAVEDQDALAMIATNQDLHMAIAHAAGNRYYIEVFERLLDEGRRMLRIYYRTFGDSLPAPYVAEHDDMIAAIEARDVDLADALATAHASQIARQFQRFLAAETAADIDLAQPPAV